MLFGLDRVFEKVGQRVFTYDCKWGIIETVGADGWNMVQHDDGTKNIFNAERMSLRDNVNYYPDPKGVKDA